MDITSITDIKEKYQAHKPSSIDPNLLLTPTDGVNYRIRLKVQECRGFGATFFLSPDGVTDFNIFVRFGMVQDPKDWNKVLEIINLGKIIEAEGAIYWSKKGLLVLCAQTLIALE